MTVCPNSFDIAFDNVQYDRNIFHHHIEDDMFRVVFIKYQTALRFNKKRRQVLLTDGKKSGMAKFFASNHTFYIGFFTAFKKLPNLINTKCRYLFKKYMLPVSECLY